MKKRINFYSDEYKMKVVQEYLNCQLSQQIWMRRFGLEVIF